jgi:uncharacterized protein
MPAFALSYTYDTATAPDRDKVRPRHVEFLQHQFDAGRLRISGPVDGGGGALLVISGEDEQDVLSLMDGDPFAQEGLIAERSVRRWDVFFGKDKL